MPGLCAIARRTGAGESGEVLTITASYDAVSADRAARVSKVRAAGSSGRSIGAANTVAAAHGLLPTVGAAHADTATRLTAPSRATATRLTAAGVPPGCGDQSGHTTHSHPPTAIGCRGDRHCGHEASPPPEVILTPTHAQPRTPPNWVRPQESMSRSEPVSTHHPRWRKQPPWLRLPPPQCVGGDGPAT